MNNETTLLQNYVKQIKQRFEAGNSTEHSYRSDLQILIQSLVSDVTVTNEPKRQLCGAPDYIIQRKEVPLGYIEAKDVGADLDKVEKTEQLKVRYLPSLDNLILTDYLEFRFYRYAQKLKVIPLASIENGKLKPLTENFEILITHLKDFCSFTGQTIKSSEKLAQMMAQKARMMEEVILKAVTLDDGDSALKDQFIAFKQILIHDLDEKTFSDIYAQTIAYGLFAARLHDESAEDFTRTEAMALIPRSNPFLRQLFKWVSDPDLDIRIDWIINDLADIFRATDLKAILKDFGKSTGQDDPFIHFYETFLAAYDPKLRKSRGVWYTPEPVVNFIVRAVDDILKSEFGLSRGLADTSKIKIKVDQQGTKVEKETHRVQILDPACGTGTFLAETVQQIYRNFIGQEGIWNQYVEEHLIPRLNGFELLMASYTMAHLKLDMLLKGTGYVPTSDQRFNIYLTNSLEEHHPDTESLFTSWLSNEANEANRIKRDTPVMVVMGNPPYSVSSSNKSEWIQNLIADYKKDLNERNIQPLSDDYIKFIRYGQYLIDKNGEGILAYISNNSFIDGLIHKQMRKHLMKSFSKIYIFDLHGSTKRREKAIDGSKDENVFDILPGVSINIFIKTQQSTRTKALIQKFDLFGKRAFKYAFLSGATFYKIPWKSLKNLDEKFSFKEFVESKLTDENSFLISNLFLNYASGITTERDALTIQFDKDKLDEIKHDFLESDEITLRSKYDIGPDGRDWKLSTAINDLKTGNPYIARIYYRPFDWRYTLFTGNTKGFLSYPRSKIMSNLLEYGNYALVIGRQGQAIGGKEWNIVNVCNNIADCNLFYRGRATVLPLYIDHVSKADLTARENARAPSQKTSNLNIEIVQQIAVKLKLAFGVEKKESGITFTAVDLLDYIYSVLHSPSYREKYKEFLKIDFPRIPYPTDTDKFWKLVKLGGQIRQLHLLESPEVNNFITTYPVSGTNEVAAGFPKYELDPIATDKHESSGKVFVNPDQYFDNVPEIAWNFYIGGYQPAQKWLKDRRCRTLTFEDINHYQRMIVALTETDRLMVEIDKIFIN